MEPAERKDYRPLLLLTIVAFLSLLLRSWQLNSESLWMDEGFTAYQSAFPLGQMLTSLAGVDQHPPLYYLIVRFFRGLMGSSEWVLRLPSVLSSMVLIFAVYHVALRLYSGRIALNAATLIAFSAFGTLMAREARSYIFFSCLVLACSYFFLKMLNRERGAAYPYILFTVIALYTHNFSVIICGGQLFYYLYRLARTRSGILPLREAGLVLLAVLFLYGPWLFYFLQQMKANYDLHVVSADAFTVLVVFYSELVSFHLAYKYLAGWYCVAFAGLLAFFFGALKERKEADLFLLYSFLFFLTVIVLLTVFTRWKAFEPRYLITYAPVYWILVARSIDCTGSRLIRGALLILLLGMNLQSVYNLYTFQSERKQEWRSAVAYLTSHEKRGDLILVSPGLAQYAFRYYYDRDSRYGNQVVAVFPAEVRDLREKVPRGRVWLLRAAAGLVDPQETMAASFYRAKKYSDRLFLQKRNAGHSVYVELFEDP